MKLSTLPARIKAADMVVFLDVPRRACFWGLLMRRIRYRGRMQPEIGVYDRINTELLRFVWSFRTKKRPQILKLLEPTQATILTSWRDADEWIQDF
jgi:adenylate kinase family enzyme